MTDDDDDIERFEFDGDELEITAREPFDPTERGAICDFVWAVLRTDDDSYREIPKLAECYRFRSPEFRAGIDQAFIALCGWTFGTILHAAKTGKSLQDASDREKSPEEVATFEAHYPGLKAGADGLGIRD
jgi:hypothetical protein